MRSRPLRAILWLCMFSTLMVITALGGCSSRSPERHLAYADNGFSVRVNGHYRRTAFDGYGGNPDHVGDSYTDRSIEVAATVTVGAPDSLGHRSASVTFSAPASLEGITVTRQSADDGRQDVTVTCDGITVSHPKAYDRLLWIADAILPLGDVASVSPVTNGDYTLRLQTADGEETRTFTCRKDILYPTAVTYVHPDGEAVLHLTFTS